MLDNQWELTVNKDTVVFKGSFRDAVRVRATEYSNRRFSITHPTKGSYSGHFSLRIETLSTVLVRRTVKPVTADGSVKITRNRVVKKARTCGKFVLSHYDYISGDSHINLPDCAVTVRRYIKKLHDAYDSTIDLRPYRMSNTCRAVKPLSLLVYCVVALNLKWGIGRDEEGFAKHSPFVVRGVDQHIGQFLFSPAVVSACNNIERYDHLEAFLNLASAPLKADRLWQLPNSRYSCGMTRNSLYFYIIQNAVPWRIHHSGIRGLPESNIDIASDVDAAVILFSNNYMTHSFNENLFRSLGNSFSEIPNEDLVAVTALTAECETILAVIQNQIKWWPKVSSCGSLTDEFLIRSTDAVLLIASGALEPAFVREYQRD